MPITTGRILSMKFGVIGYGNLGKAFVKGLLYTGFSANDIVINVRSEKTRNEIQEELEARTQASLPVFHVTGSKKELVEQTDAVVVVVEPKNAAEVLQELGTYPLKEKVILSFMAGITRNEIRQMLGEQGENATVIRVMPNIAIANGNGVLGITYDETSCETVQETICTLEKLGYLLKLEEDGLDYITVTAASGLAFVAALMNSYQKASNTLFQNEIQSKEITLHIFENMLDMMKKETSSFEDIIKRITTKGGTTEAGLNHLNQEMITETLTDCMQSSYAKCKKIK